jgi:hypothetical protein
MVPKEGKTTLIQNSLVLEMPDMARYVGFIIAFLVMVGLLWYVNKKMTRD